MNDASAAADPHAASEVTLAKLNAAILFSNADSTGVANENVGVGIAVAAVPSAAVVGVAVKLKFGGALASATESGDADVSTEGAKVKTAGALGDVADDVLKVKTPLMAVKRSPSQF